MGRQGCKVMDAREAVSRFVHDGDHLVIGNYSVSSCIGLIFEVIRQERKGLTLYNQAGALDVEVMIASGCVDRFVGTYVNPNPGGSAFERALQNGSLQMEDYTNFQYNARMVAGMHGFSFMPVLSGPMVTDLFKKRGFMGEGKYGVITCPFTGRKTLTVPAANPDVCIVHVQRADEYGNAQYWGSLGSVAAAALASKRIIVSCEEIIGHDIVQSSPQMTILPAYRVDAVVEMPWGAHPTEVLGHYNLDRVAYSMFLMANATVEGLKAWMDEWIYSLQDRSAYLDHYMEKFGSDALNALRARPHYSAPVDYGSAYSSSWDRSGRDRDMGVTIEELERIMEERGILYEQKVHPE